MCVEERASIVCSLTHRIGKARGGVLQMLSSDLCRAPGRQAGLLGSVHRIPNKEEKTSFGHKGFNCKKMAYPQPGQSTHLHTSFCGF